MDPSVARRTWRSLEPVHGLIYFAPEATAAYGELGLPAASGYFASRAAPMGAVTGEVVVATFYNFSPGFVLDAIPSAWSIASPEQILAARTAAAGDMLRRVLGDLAEGPHVDEAADLAERAAASASEHVEGRPLFAGHAALEWPEDPLVRLWHAQSLLREFRGDGHIAALVLEGVSGLEALLLHGASGEVPGEALRATRQWSDDEWRAGLERLCVRGLLEHDGSFTDQGAALRQRIEDTTDRLAVAAYEPLGDEGCARLRELGRPLSRAIVQGGAFGL